VPVAFQRNAVEQLYGIIQYYDASQKKDTLLISILREILIDFQNLFIARLSRKFATKRLLNITSHLKDVAALPCETVMFKKSHKFKNTVPKNIVLKKNYADLLTKYFNFRSGLPSSPDLNLFDYKVWGIM